MTDKQGGINSTDNVLSELGKCQSLGAPSSPRIVASIDKINFAEIMTLGHRFLAQFMVHMGPLL